MAYPNSPDNLPTNHVDPPSPGAPEKIAASIVNNIATSINAIISELGLNPSDVYVDVATRLLTLEFVQYTTVTLGTYTLSAGDASKTVVGTLAGGTVITVPANSSVPFRSGTIIPVRAGTSAGTVSVVGASGVTIFNPYNSFALAGPSAQAQLQKIGTDAWSFNGEVA